MENDQIEKTISYWLTSAEYDLEVSDSLFSKKKFHYSLFFGHLALEKLLKAIFVKRKKSHAPFSHSLPYLAEKSELDISSEKLETLAEFMEFYFEGRYPKDMQVIFEKYTHSFCKIKLDEIKEMFGWLKTIL